ALAQGGKIGGFRWIGSLVHRLDNKKAPARDGAGLARTLTVSGRHFSVFLGGRKRPQILPPRASARSMECTADGG
ncbi:MAG: hypothetical protein ACR2F9_05350, partial [Longimicrobiaceae bacterium]